MKKTIYNIQSLRGFAAVSVLLFHMLLMEKKWGSGNKILPDFLTLGASGVDLFFIISGFIMVVVTRGQFQKKGAVLRFSYNRISRIYPLYWFYSFILLCIFLIRPELINPTMGNQVNLLESFLLLPQKMLPLLMVGWPLVHEMYFYIVFGFLLLTPEKHLVQSLIVWGIVTIFGYAVIQNISIFSTNPYLSIVFNPLTLEFIAGCFLAILIIRYKGRYGFVMIVIGILLLLLSGFYYHLYPSTPVFDARLRVLFFGIPYSFILYGAAAIEVGKKKLLSKGLQKIGDQSYSLYLSHTLVINGIGWIWAYMNLTDSRFHLWFVISMFVISVVTGYVSYQLIEKPMVTIAKRFSEKINKNGFRLTVDG